MITIESAEYMYRSGNYRISSVFPVYRGGNYRISSVLVYRSGNCRISNVLMYRGGNKLHCKHDCVILTVRAPTQTRYKQELIQKVIYILKMDNQLHQQMRKLAKKPGK